MLCCPNCSQLSIILNNIVTPDSGSTGLLLNNVGSKTLFNPGSSGSAFFAVQLLWCHPLLFISILINLDDGRLGPVYMEVG